MTLSVKRKKKKQPKEEKKPIEWVSLQQELDDNYQAIIDVNDRAADMMLGTMVEKIAGPDGEQGVPITPELAQQLLQVPDALKGYTRTFRMSITKTVYNRMISELTFINSALIGTLQSCLQDLAKKHKLEQYCSNYSVYLLTSIYDDYGENRKIDPLLAEDLHTKADHIRFFGQFAENHDFIKDVTITKAYENMFVMEYVSILEKNIEELFSVRFKEAINDILRVTSGSGKPSSESVINEILPEYYLEACHTLDMTTNAFQDAYRSVFKNTVATYANLYPAGCEKNINAAEAAMWDVCGYDPQSNTVRINENEDPIPLPPPPYMVGF